MNILAKEHTESALRTTAQAVADYLITSEAQDALTTFHIKTHTSLIPSDYGDAYEMRYVLVVPPDGGGLSAMLVTNGEIVYLNAHDASWQQNLRRLPTEELPDIYRSITERRPIEYQVRHERGYSYDDSAPCTIAISGIQYETERNIYYVSADEIISNMREEESRILGQAKKQVMPTLENRFQRAARLRKESGSSTTE